MLPAPSIHYLVHILHWNAFLYLNLFVYVTKIQGTEMRLFLKADLEQTVFLPMNKIVLGSLCECCDGVRKEWRKRIKQGEGRTPSCGVRVSACGGKEHYVTPAPPHVGVWVTSKCQRDRVTKEKSEREGRKNRAGDDVEGNGGERGVESDRSKRKRLRKKEMCSMHFEI